MTYEEVLILQFDSENDEMASATFMPRWCFQCVLRQPQEKQEWDCVTKASLLQRWRTREKVPLRQGTHTYTMRPDHD